MERTWRMIGRLLFNLDLESASDFLLNFVVCANNHIQTGYIFLNSYLYMYIKMDCFV